MPSKKTKTSSAPDNSSSRSKRKRHSPAADERSQAPPWQRIVLAAAFLLAALWCALYLLAPQWPAAIMPADGEGNGPRVLLLFAPESILEGWFAGPVSGAGLLQRMKVLAVAAGVLTLAWVCGRWLLSAAPPFSTRSESTSWGRRAEALAMALAVGLSMHSLVVFAVGLAGGIGRWWSGPLVAVATLALTAVAAGLLRRRSVPASEPASESAAETASETATSGAAFAWADYVALFAGVVLALVVVARALLPPAEYDVREYHLQAPKEWSQQGQIVFLPHNIYSSMPMAAEMQALATMDWWRIATNDSPWWWGALSGKVVIAVYALLAAVLSACAVARFAGRTAGLWTAALALAMPEMIEGAALGLIDAAVACYLAAGVLIVVITLQHRDENKNVAAGWAGFFAGSALACKYPALVFVVLPLGLACWFWQSDVRAARRASALLCFALVAGIVAGPWFLKNLVQTGNPVYPLLGEVFGGRSFSQQQIQQWDRGHATGPMSWQELTAAAARLSWQAKGQSLLLVPLALLALADRWWQRPVRWAAGGLLLSLLLWWLLTHRIARFLVPVLPLLFLLAGAGWHVLRQRLGTRAAVGIGAFGIALNGLMISGPLLGDVRLAVDLSALRVDRTAEGPSRVGAHVRYVNQRLQRSDRVLSVGDAAVFDFEVPVDYSTTFDDSPLTAITSTLPESQWHEAFEQAGWTHVLVHWGEIQRLRSTYGFDPRITPELFERLEQAGVLTRTQQAIEGGPVELYEVR
ncbi:ArnT family glycosyltransferase [Roseimaritima sediminicola]|uniref:ArnT family glycosyltransferase n=1 Tax=Roseimaritima sediminicola TaxID=2662066 RepID=UPI001386F2DF|nr:hypothetical protein [Roseimaritima sediminicola]